MISLVMLTLSIHIKHLAMRLAFFVFVVGGDFIIIIIIIISCCSSSSSSSSTCSSSSSSSISSILPRLQRLNTPFNCTEAQWLSGRVFNFGPKGH